MKILVIGDPHGCNKYKKSILKKADLILLTGDIGKANLASKMTFNSFERKKQGLSEIKYSTEQIKKAFKETYNSTLLSAKYISKFAPVYIIYGNIESTPHIPLRKSTFAKEVGLTNKLNALKNVRVVNNRIANFNDIRIGGLEYFTDTCWVREFKPADFRKKIREAKKETDKAKKVLKWFNNLDILLCHQPPYGILDKVGFSGAPKSWKGKHAGSKIILDYIQKKQPKYVFCGHIHEAKGKAKIGKSLVYNMGESGDYLILDTEKNKVTDSNFFK